MASRFKFARIFSVTWQQAGNLQTGTEMLNPCIDVLRITIFKNTIEKLHLMAVLFVNFILFLIFVLYIIRYTITTHSHTDPYLRDL